MSEQTEVLHGWWEFEVTYGHRDYPERMYLEHPVLHNPTAQQAKMAMLRRASENEQWLVGRSPNGRPVLVATTAVLSVSIVPTGRPAETGANSQARGVGGETRGAPCPGEQEEK